MQEQSLFEGTDLQYSTSYFFVQFLHPCKAEGYREVSRTLRMIGREWIQKRIKAIENKEAVPNDILTRTLKLACKYTCNFVSTNLRTHMHKYTHS